MFTYNICPCIAFTREIQRSGAKARKDLDQICEESELWKYYKIAVCCTPLYSQSLGPSDLHRQLGAVFSHRSSRRK